MLSSPKAYSSEKNRRAARELPPDAPAVASPEAEKEETRDRFTKRRCATCRETFETGDAGETRCQPCVRTIGHLPAAPMPSGPKTAAIERRLLRPRNGGGKGTGL